MQKIKLDKITTSSDHMMEIDEEEHMADKAGKKKPGRFGGRDFPMPQYGYRPARKTPRRRPSK